MSKPPVAVDETAETGCAFRHKTTPVAESLNRGAQVRTGATERALWPTDASGENPLRGGEHCRGGAERCTACVRTRLLSGGEPQPA